MPAHAALLRRLGPSLGWLLSLPRALLLVRSACSAPKNGAKPNAAPPPPLVCSASTAGSLVPTSPRPSTRPSSQRSTAAGTGSAPSAHGERGRHPPIRARSTTSLKSTDAFTAQPPCRCSPWLAGAGCSAVLLPSCGRPPPQLRCGLSAPTFTTTTSTTTGSVPAPALFDNRHQPQVDSKRLLRPPQADASGPRPGQPHQSEVLPALPVGGRARRQGRQKRARPAAAAQRALHM